MRQRPPASLEARVRRMELPTVRPNTSSIELDLLGTWVSFGSGHKIPSYYRTRDGRIGLEGTVTAGSSSSTIATLPEGNRPSAICLFAVPADGAFGVVQVEADGDIRHVAGSTTKLSLDSVSFKAAQ